MAKTTALATTTDKETGMSINVPSYIKEIEGDAKSLSILTDVDVATGMLRLSLDKERFTVVEGRTEVQKLGRDPINVRFIHIHPTVQRTKYEKAYDGDAETVDRPICWSNDGKVPDADVPEPQHTDCKGCPHNKKGSGGGKRKACSTSRNTVVHLINPETGEEMHEPVMLRINASSHFSDPDAAEGLLNFTRLLKLARRQEAAGALLQMYQVELDFAESGENNQLNFYVHPEPCDRETFMAIMEEREANDFAEACMMSFQSDDENDDAEETKKAAPKKQSRAPRRQSGKTAQPADAGEKEATPDATDAAPAESKPKPRRGRKATAAPAAAPEPTDPVTDVIEDEPSIENTSDSTIGDEELDAETLALLGDADDLDLD